MKLNLLHEMLINETELRKATATRAEMLGLQTHLIDNVEGSENIDFELREDNVFGFAIHLKHQVHGECDVFRVNRVSMVGNDYGYGIKIKGKRLKTSSMLKTLVHDIHDWLNGWTNLWN